MLTLHFARISCDSIFYRICLFFFSVYSLMFTNPYPSSDLMWVIHLEKWMWHLFLFSVFHSCYIQHILRPYPWIYVVGNPATVTNKNPNISVPVCLPYIRTHRSQWAWHLGDNDSYTWIQKVMFSTTLVVCTTTHTLPY